MKNAVFMTKKPQNLKNVYNIELQEKLRGELNFFENVHSIDDIISRKSEMQRVDFIFSTWGMLPLTKAEIEEYFPNLQAIFYAAGTVQYFARDFLESGVKISSAYASNGIPVSEACASIIVLANKGYLQRRVKSLSQWRNDDDETVYPGNYNTNVGIIGAGAIGKKVIALLKNYDLNIFVFDKFLPDEQYDILGVKKASLYEIFEKCHVISNHLADKTETKGMIDKNCFERMAKNAVFVNTGRGAQINMDDLIDALKKEPTRSAFMDVTDPTEPPQAESELYKLDNVYLSPHICGSIGNEVHRMAKYMYEEYRRFISNEPLKYEITLNMLETMA